MARHRHCALTGIWCFLLLSVKPAGEDQKIDFSNVAEISAYIPQIRIRAFPYPLLACDIDDMPDTLIGWTDTHNTYDIHNLIYDIPYEDSKREGRTTALPNKPATISEHEDEDDPSSTQDRDSATAEAADETNEIPKWPIYSLVKHYPRTFKRGN